MEPAELQIFYHPEERLRMTVGDDRTYITVKPVWAAPLSHPKRYLALLDGAGAEIITIPDLEALPPESRAVVERELRLRYLTSTVASVTYARQEYGATYWGVVTDRGERDFVTQNLQENAVWFSDTHLLLIDVEANRFEIPDVEALDKKSQETIESIL